jgi:hypothetical protein
MPDAVSPGALRRGTADAERRRRVLASGAEECCARSGFERLRSDARTGFVAVAIWAADRANAWRSSFAEGSELPQHTRHAGSRRAACARTAGRFPAAALPRAADRGRMKLFPLLALFASVTIAPPSRTLSSSTATRG